MRGRCRTERTRWFVAGVVALLGVGAMGASACASDSGASAADGRTAGVYQPILEWLAADEPQAEPGEKPEWTMFVASRSHVDIDIDAQVVLIASLDDELDLRFIDDRDEAVVADDGGEVVRDGGLLVGLGAVDEVGDRVEVYADSYRHAGDVKAWLVTVERSGDRWRIAGTPTLVPVRPLPPDE